MNIKRLLIVLVLYAVFSVLNYWWYNHQLNTIVVPNPPRNATYIQAIQAIAQSQIGLTAARHQRKAMIYREVLIMCLAGIGIVLLWKR
jgi:uncharacterized membrane protein YfcA